MTPPDILALIEEKTKFFNQYGGDDTYNFTDREYGQVLRALKKCIEQRDFYIKSGSPFPDASMESENIALKAILRGGE